MGHVPSGIVVALRHCLPSRLPSRLLNRLLSGLLWALPGGGLAAQWVDFSTPQVHPLALSADGLRLSVVNTPDGRLAVYSLQDPDRPVLLREIRVGIEPISVAMRNPDEAWVVNHLSDTVSVVDLRRGVVVDTLHVADEPMDVAFAGGRAFVSIAGNRVVRVFDATQRRFLADVAIFAQDPAALAVSLDGTKVFVAARLSGNKTTVVPEHLAPPPPPPTNPALPPAPQTSMLVASDDPRWQSSHRVVLPDLDVFAIDAATLAITSSHAGVGTILFGLAQRPGTQEVWVANTEARNLVRFAPALRGHAVDNRVTRIDTGTGATTAIDLNPAVDYSVLPDPGAVATALAQPTDLVWAPDGSELYVAAFGTDRVAVLDPAGNVQARIEVGSVRDAQIEPRRKRGPRALVHHPGTARLYVANRLSNSLTVVDTARRRVVRELVLPDPTDPRHKSARGFLYDAKLSGNGTMSCASCHVDGLEDGLAWDLGDPDGVMEPVFDRVRNVTIHMHPMKGPMLTQTLLGLDSVSPFHWRGDRARLQDFNGTFAEVMGGQPLATQDMDDLAAFMSRLTYPPNPNQDLDGSLAKTPPGTSARRGFSLYLEQTFNGAARCVDCHAMNPLIVPGSVFGRAQAFNIPALRNTYKHARRTSGPQGSVTGFGLLHDGSADDVVGLLTNPAFGPLTTNLEARQALQSFVLAVNVGTMPAITGFGRTLRADDYEASLSDFWLLVAQAEASRCDLVAAGELDGRVAGLRYDAGAGHWLTDRSAEAPYPTAALLGLVRQQRARLTLLAVPPAFGQRLGLDRDGNGVLDGDEGVDVYGAASPPCAGAVELTGNGSPRLGNEQFAVSVAGLSANGPALLLLGQRTSQWLLGIEFLVDVTAGGVTMVMPVDAGGTGVVSLPIPMDPSLVGQIAHLQAIFAAPCAPYGVAASQGLRLAILR